VTRSAGEATLMEKLSRICADALHRGDADVAQWISRNLAREERAV